MELTAERSSAVEARGISVKAKTDATATAAAEPPWIPLPEDVDWEALAAYPNPLAAHIAAGLLDNEGLATIITAWTSFPGTVPAVLWVPKHLVRRARWIAALPSPSDAELLFLATGELSSGKEGT